jgi:hypothetical protein
MAKIDSTTLRNWNNGEVMYEADYEKERAILVAAINDNFDRLIKSIITKDSNGSITGTRTLAQVMTGLVLKNGTGMSITVDPNSDTVTFSVNQPDKYVKGNMIDDAAIKVEHIDPNVFADTQGVDLGVHRAAATLDHPDRSVSEPKLADASVSTRTIGDGQVSITKLGTDVQNLLNNLQVLQMMEVNV